MLTLGTLTQSANALARSSTRWSIVSENWLQVNEFRSVLRRLREYEAALFALRAPPQAQLVPNGVELSDAAPAGRRRRRRRLPAARRPTTPPTAATSGVARSPRGGSQRSRGR